MITVPDEIKDLLHLDHCQKNIRIHFPNGERSDICNDLIVKDSVSFTESLCSQNTLKFGLCESPVFECEVVGVGNVKGASIEVYGEIYCDPSVSGAIFQPDLNAYVYQISYGQFLIDSCKREADMIHRKIQAYGQGNNAELKNCPIIKFASDVLYMDNSAYEPRVFPLMIMASQSTGKNPNLTYTELSFEADDFCIPLSFYQDSLPPYHVHAYGLVCKVLQYRENASSSFNNDDELYYLEYDDPSVSAATLGHGMKPEYFNGGILRDPSISVLNKALYWNKGKYIYPYQVLFTPSTWNAEISYPYNDIFIPYKFSKLDNPYGYDVWGKWYPTGTPIQFRNTPKIYKVDISGYPQDRLYIERTIVKEFEGYPTKYSWDYDLVDFVELFNGQLELAGLFGRLNRSNYMDFINIKRQFGLIPGAAVYPGVNVYPEGVTGGQLLPHDYQSCWYDDEYSIPYGAVKCTYKNENNEDTEYILYLTGYSETSNADTYQVYDLSGNKIISSSIWTKAQIQAICANIAANIEGVQYMPVDFVGRGLPYVEAGDTFEILTKSNDSITTIVLNRTLTGEQTLTDSYKSV